MFDSEFNPKGWSLLDEQLAVSGLEMNLFGIIAGVGAVVSGVMGASQASSNNSRARSNQKKQEEFNKKTAKLTNEYNDKLDAADVANYEAMREYSHETSLQNWQRSGEIQDYQYLGKLKEYEKNINISRDQLALNVTSADQAIQSEGAAVGDMFLQQQFQRESSLAALKSVYTEANLNRQSATLGFQKTKANAGFDIRGQNLKLLGIQSQKQLGTASINNEIDQLMKQGSFAKTNAMVEGLIKEGRAAMGQAGKSKAKRQQSASAALHRGLMALETELTGKRKQAGIELAQLSADTSLAKTGVGLNIERIKSNLSSAKAGYGLDMERIQNSIDAAEADAEYNNRVMTANMKSFISQTERNIKDIQLQKQVADLNVRESTMIKPERLSYDPVPQLPPEREFVERMEAIPGFVPQAAQQSVWAPLIQGITGGASQAWQMGQSK